MLVPQNTIIKLQLLNRYYMLLTAVHVLLVVCVNWGAYVCAKSRESQLNRNRCIL